MLKSRQFVHVLFHCRFWNHGISSSPDGSFATSTARARAWSNRRQLRLIIRPDAILNRFALIVVFVVLKQLLHFDAVLIHVRAASSHRLACQGWEVGRCIIRVGHNITRGKHRMRSLHRHWHRVYSCAHTSIPMTGKNHWPSFTARTLHPLHVSLCTEYIHHQAKEILGNLRAKRCLLFAVSQTVLLFRKNGPSLPCTTLAARRQGVTSWKLGSRESTKPKPWSSGLSGISS